MPEHDPGVEQRTSSYTKAGNYRLKNSRKTFSKVLHMPPHLNQVEIPVKW